jgi:hypothetical protein
MPLKIFKIVKDSNFVRTLCARISPRAAINCVIIPHVLTHACLFLLSFLQWLQLLSGLPAADARGH